MLGFIPGVVVGYTTVNRNVTEGRPSQESFLLMSCHVRISHSADRSASPAEFSRADREWSEPFSHQEDAQHDPAGAPAVHGTAGEPYPLSPKTCPNHPPRSSNSMSGFDVTESNICLSFAKRSHVAWEDQRKLRNWSDRVSHLRQ